MRIDPKIVYHLAKKRRVMLRVLKQEVLIVSLTGTLQLKTASGYTFAYVLPIGKVIRDKSVFNSPHNTNAWESGLAANTILKLQEYQS